MVIRDLLNIGQEKLKELEFVDSALESTLILSKIINKDRSYIYAYLDKDINEEDSSKFLEIIELRSKGYPYHYIFKEKSFLDLDLYVEDGVLIPRWETEMLVEYIIEYVKDNYEDVVNILDIGVGSGTISVSLAHKLENADVVGIDIDEKAIEVASKNKDRYKLDNLRFYKGDLFQALAKNKIEDKFDIIVSNPPYIKKDDIKGLQKDVKDYEPITALDGGLDGLDFYRKISSESKNYFKEKGLIIYEIGYNQGIEVEKILKNEGFINTEIIKDLQGHDRIVLGIKP